MKVSLRPATTADATRVADILIESRSAFMPYAPSAHSEEEVRAWVREQLVPGGGVTVAVRDARLVGVVALSHDGEYGWVNQMFVDPGHVGLGIGSALLAHTVESLTSPIRLYTFQANVGARRFYERHGFNAIELTDGSTNEERCPDVLYERRDRRQIDFDPSTA